MSEQTYRTREKIKENLGLLMDFFKRHYGHTDDDVERILFNALDWTATDVQAQCEGQSDSNPSSN